MSDPLGRDSDGWEQKEDDREEKLQASVQQTLEQIDEALGLVEDIEQNFKSIWEKSGDFFPSVRAKLTDIGKTIRKRQDVSLQQKKAVENMHAGVCKWHPDHRD